MAIQDDNRNHYFTIPAKWDTNPDLDGMDRYLLMTINNLSRFRRQKWQTHRCGTY